MKPLCACLLVLLVTGCATLPEPTIGPPLAERNPDRVEAMAIEAESVPAVPPPPEEPAPLELVFFDVGQGDSTLIRCPDGTSVLVDAGSTDGLTSSGEQRYFSELSNLLQVGGEEKLDILVITHPDADHYNLIAEALAGVPVSQVIYTGERTQYSSFGGWLSHFDNTGRSIQPAASDFDPPGTPSSILPCGSASIWLLAGNVFELDSDGDVVKNTLSIVLRVAHGDFEAVLTGDATFTTENTILGRYPSDWLQSDLLKAGHHGSRATSTSRAWANAIAPEIVIASAAASNGYGHPSVDILARVTRSTGDLPKSHRIWWCVGKGNCGSSFVDEAIYATPKAGTITVRSDGNTFSVSCSGDSAYC